MYCEVCGCIGFGGAAKRGGGLLGAEPGGKGGACRKEVVGRSLNKKTSD